MCWDGHGIYNNINTQLYCYVLTRRRDDYQNRLPRERPTGVDET